MCVRVKVFLCVHSAPVHLHVWTAFPQCSRAKYKRVIWHFQESLLQAAALDLFPQTGLFWKNHCIVIFYYSYDPLEVLQLPFLWHFASFAFLLFLPPAQCFGPHSFAAFVTSKTSPPTPTSLCPFPLLTLNTNHWPAAPAASLLSHDPLTSSCFSCCRRQLSKCLCEELLSFSLSPDQFPKWTLWHVLKYSRWWKKKKKIWHSYCILILKPRNGLQRGD